jgi:hypothetical protein
MRKSKRKPCRVCRAWFDPDPRVGSRQHTCSKAECQATRRKWTVAGWARRNPDYAAAWLLSRRAKQAKKEERDLEPLAVPRPLDQLPWDVAEAELGRQGADFLAIMGRLLARPPKDQTSGHDLGITGGSGRVPQSGPKDQTCAEPGEMTGESGGVPQSGPKDQMPALSG